jgi:hypothetical protein
MLETMTRDDLGVSSQIRLDSFISPCCNLETISSLQTILQPLVPTEHPIVIPCL